MKIRILCYKPKIDGHFLDDAISAWTKIWNWCPKELDTSHAEVWIPDNREIFIGVDHLMKTRNVYGTCYTSTMRKPYNGVCRRSASSVLRHPDRWNYFNIDIPDQWYKAFILWMDEKVRSNQGYDKKTIASYFWYKRLGDPDKYICSEFVHLSILPFVWRTNRLWMNNLINLDCPSPLRLAHALHKSGLDLYSLETGQVILKGQK
jgi:hypothetical protein